MIQSNQKTSLQVPYQLPKFISEDPAYANFVLFVKAYYEWLEQENNVLDRTKNILNDLDIDTTSEEFLQYYLNDFMSYFPQEILADKRKAIKVAKQLYQSKGTPASYELLFRILYNSDVDFFYTKDAVLRASAGKWYIPKSLKLNTNDKNFLAITNLRLLGDISKAIATVENSIFDGLKTEVFISHVERLFVSGETVTVVDSRNQPVYFLNDVIVSAGTPNATTLSATIVGQISQVSIDPNNRGSYYRTHDPVVVYGGLNPEVAGPLGATVEVNQVTSGSIQSVSVLKKGYGYTLSTPNPMTGSGNANTQIVFSVGIGSAPTATVGSLDQDGKANVTNIPVDSIALKQSVKLSNTNFYFANIAVSNVNTTLAEALSFASFSTYPISSVVVGSQGGGILKNPTIEAVSQYELDNLTQARLSNLGILSPIQISEAGTGYANGDLIMLIGGSGFGANANVSVVDPSGAILEVGYIANTSYKVSLGGMGYNTTLPVAVVKRNATGSVTTSTSSNVVIGTGTSFTSQFANGAPLVTSNNIVLGTIQTVVNANTIILTSNAYSDVTTNTVYLGTAILTVPGILGTGAQLEAVPNRIGQITSFNILENGEDYISAPKVSLKVQDLIVKNVSSLSLPGAGDIVYQGANTNVATYYAYVDSITALENHYPETDTIYKLRVYNYTSKPKQTLPLNIVDKDTITLVPNYTGITDTRFDSANGVITYGDGEAKANAKFLSGLVIGQGQYLDSSGQPSAFDVLQSEIYNNYTYRLTLSKEIEKYRDVLLNLIHPAGMKVLGRVAMKSNTSMKYTGVDALSTLVPLDYIINNGGSAKITAGSASNPSNNIVVLQTYGIPTNTIFVANSSSIVFNYGPGPADYVKSLVLDVDDDSIVINHNVWTYFANVAVGEAIAGNNRAINITSFTGSYDIVNGGVYSNTSNPIIDVIRVGDNLSVNGNSSVVVSVNTDSQVVVVQNNLIYGANGLITISRTLNSTYNSVLISNPVGIQYFPELTTDAGETLLTEDGKTILLG